MINRKLPRVRILFISLLGLLPASRAMAVLDKFEPYAIARVVHDSNVFRVADDQQLKQLLGSTKQDDTITSLGVGLKSDLKLSRQHLLFDGKVLRTRYDNYSELDHTGLRGSGKWVWAVGNLWSGDVTATYDRTLRSFTQTKLLQKDLRTRKAGYFDGGYDVTPDWRVEGGLSYTTVDYENRKDLDRKYGGGHVEVQYRNTLNTRVGVRVEHTDYSLQDSVINSVTVSNDYKENEVSGVFYWEGSAKSKLEARLGYTDTSFQDVNQRDYQGTSGRLTYHWILTGKTQLNLSAWRETSSLNDEVQTYVLTQGVSLSPKWALTPLISLGGDLRYQNDDFKARDDITATGQRRKDDTYRAGINANWSPRQFVRVSLGYRYEKRDSSLDFNDFTDNQINAGVQINFY